MPQKKSKRIPIAPIVFALIVLICAAYVCVSVFSGQSGRVTDIAGISLSRISSVTVKVRDGSGKLAVNTISDKNELEAIFDRLENTRVKKRLSLGGEGASAQDVITVRLNDGSAPISISQSDNCFKKQNSGLFSAFVSCYYDVQDAVAFRALLGSFSM